MMKPLLLNEDGATFHSLIETVSDHKFRATYYVRLDLGDSITEEVPKTKIFQCQNDAKVWVGHCATVRKFDKIYEI